MGDNEADRTTLRKGGQDEENNFKATDMRFGISVCIQRFYMRDNIKERIDAFNKKDNKL